LDGVVQAAVVGVPDEVFGQAVKAVLVANAPGLTEARVLAHCRANLEAFMVPKYIEFRQQLPTTASGKIARSELV
jgi:acyl-CoA synthetase (AMP-forming)/AMP-acid ligase II